MRQARILSELLQQALGLEVVAVKIPHRADSMEQEDRNRFYLEVCIMALVCNHPNIVRFIGYTENPPSIVMQRYQCSAKDAIVKPELFERISPSSWLFAALCVARGLQGTLMMVLITILLATEIHRLDVVHLDIKPHNILLNLNEKHEVMDAVITDFGLSTIVGGEMSGRDRVVAGLNYPVRGGFTASYSSPEVRIESPKLGLNP